MKEVSFVVLVDYGVRLRHEHRTDRGRVVEFVVQLEAAMDEEWRPVIRYDSAHGEAHRHVHRRDGRERRETLSLTFADALTFAEADLRENRRTYVKDFVK